MMAFTLFVCFIFLMSSANCTFHYNLNHTLKYKLPNIKEGDICVQGHMYKIDCNTCSCGALNRLYCTKMVCLHDKEMADLFPNQKDHLLIQRNADYPELPEGECVPGMIYRKGFCHKCFCNDHKKIMCRITPCQMDSRDDVSRPEDIRPTFSEEEIKSLQVLPHSAAECVPGKSYKVDCNPCLCLNNGNLLCSNRLCLNYDAINKAEASKLSGKNCTRNDNECINCTCKENVMKCEAIKGCTSFASESRRRGQNPRPYIDPEVDECEPNKIYRNDCNKCLCSSEGILICTNKVCINRALALKLKEEKLLED